MTEIEGYNFRSYYHYNLVVDIVNEYLMGYFLEIFTTTYNAKDQDQRKTERDSERLRRD